MVDVLRLNDFFLSPLAMFGGPKSKRFIALLVFSLAGNGAAFAQTGFAITTDLEQIVINSVGSASWTTVNFANSYGTDAIPVCIGTGQSTATWTPVVRIQNVGATSMQIRVQKFENTPPTTPVVNVGDVNCIIARAGTASFPGGTGPQIWYQAGKQDLTYTYGSGGAGPTGSVFREWANFEGAVSVNANLDGAYPAANLPADVTLGTELGVLAQIMTYNDPLGQVAHVNDCESRARSPFDAGFSDGVCVVRHIGKLGNQSAAFKDRDPETVGYIIFRTGAGEFTHDGAAFNFSGGVSPDSVRSIRDNPPYSYSTSGSLDGGVATQQGEDGGDGSYVGLYGSSPFDGGFIDLALDESDLADRNHTTEEVAWLGFRKLAVPVDLQKAVSLPNTFGFQTLNYTITLENTSTVQIPSSDVVTNDVLTREGTVVPLTSGPTLTDPNNNGILDPGETWTYDATYNITEADYDAGGGTLLNTFTVESPPGGLIPAQQIATATTLIPVNPDLNVVKTSAILGGGAIPASGVSVGQSIEYTYTVRNDGNVAMTNVTLDDDHLGLGDDLAFVSCAITQDSQTSGNTTIGSTDFVIQTLAPRDTVTCTATYTVVQADIDNLQNP